MCQRRGGRVLIERLIDDRMYDRVYEKVCHSDLV